MENNTSQTMKTVLIVSGFIVLVVIAAVVMRSGGSPASEPQPALVQTPTMESAPAPMPARAPEPTQQISFSSLAAIDDNGAKWTLGLKGVPSQQPEDGTKSGVPLIVKADVQTKGQSVAIGLVIQGQGGETYEPGVKKNGGRMPAPKFKVLDESGTVLGSGSFEYG